MLNSNDDEWMEKWDRNHESWIERKAKRKCRHSNEGHMKTKRNNRRRRESKRESKRESEWITNQKHEVFPVSSFHASFDCFWISQNDSDFLQAERKRRSYSTRERQSQISHEKFSCEEWREDRAVTELPDWSKKQRIKIKMLPLICPRNQSNIQIYIRKAETL